MNNYALIKSAHRKKTISSSILLKFFRTLLFVFTGLFLMFYIFQTFDTVNKNHLIWVCEKEITTLIQENENLKIQLSEGCSLENIEQLAKRMNFEKNSEVDYINLSASQVAGK